MRGHIDVVGELDAFTGGDGGDQVAEAPQALGWVEAVPARRAARVDGGGGRGRRPAAPLPPSRAPATHPPGGLVSSKKGLRLTVHKVVAESVLGEARVEVLKGWPKASSESYGLRIRTSDSVLRPTTLAVATGYYDTLI
jgi:hypothetical protein